MSRFSPVPYFPTPPQQYDQRYFDQLVRSFSVFAQQMTNPGEMRATSLTLTDSTSRVDRGKMFWDVPEDTMNVTMGNGVTQQIGYETYMMVANDTGVTIPNGTVVGFSGVGAEILATPYIADGSFPALYFIGVATCDIPDGERRPVTIYGEVHELDTTGTPVGETWAVGDILYASPTTAGAFTKVRPTAPDEVIVVAAVLVVDDTVGEIMVRPTIPIGLAYGSFSDTTVQTVASTGTAYPIKFNTSDITHGVSVVNDGSGNPTKITAASAGLYMVSVSNQYTSSNSAQKDIQTWLRHNGTDVANSNSYVTLAANGSNTVFATTYLISLLAGDYIQIMWASSDTAVSLNRIAATGYSPASPSTIVTVTQIQL